MISGNELSREDVRRIADEISSRNADVIISVGGGSVIDATKAATAMVVGSQAGL